ncbi:hypothetical protein McpSp1_16160 [Methanocorpusculaceae archaeon Sp1]|nr:hypothetical protein [Methanocorpusculaceae archaeon Sp1]
MVIIMSEEPTEKLYGGIIKKKHAQLLIIGAVLIALLVISALFYFSNEGEWLIISSYDTANPPPEDRVIVITEKDFQEYPLLKQLFDSRDRIPISDNLFVTLKARDPPCVSSAEADEVISRYGWPAQLKYLRYNDSYYILNVMVT